MDKVFAWIGGSIIFVLLVVFCFWGWTEIKHDKSAVEYVQDEWGWFNDKDADSTNKTSIDDEVVVEDENGEVEATASINF